ncbi:hypothetical protein ACSVIJ_04330 [Pseudomonas sp. NCHU5208]|uniref:hypothetical protein n=1 Tax=unclassified Pseudomonas TaxID=196821 RepID=UPI003F99909C
MTQSTSVIPTILLLAMSVSGCATSDKPYPVPGYEQNVTAAATVGLDDMAIASGASKAVDIGDYAYAEKSLQKFVYRDKKGQLKLIYFGLSGETRKVVIDTVVRLLWETGRDETLLQFADDYLSSREYSVTACRLSERQAAYEQAYQCWNRMGEIDRAERVLRTEAAIRILGAQ